MEVTIRTVRLPDGRRALEHEEKFYGGSETQAAYSYYRFGIRVDKSPFKLDYWGRIEGVEVIE